MTVTIPRLISAAAIASAVLCCAAPPSRAATYGDAPWCAVVNGGADNITWLCEYNSVADCQPLVLGGNRGFCQRNPYWRGGPSPVAQYPSHHRHRATN